MPRRTECITTILFDWDGTLIDSARMGYTAFTQMFAEMGLYFDREVYENIYSPNWYSMYEKLGLPREKWQKADELWILHYGEERPSVVPGGRRTIKELLRRGYTLGIVSSGSESRVKDEIRKLDLAKAFAVVICNEHTANKKPHPEGLRKAMEALGARPEACAYVGDSPEDIETGKRARMLTVGIRSAYPGSKRLRSAQPDIYLESLLEILHQFQGR